MRRNVVGGNAEGGEKLLREAAFGVDEVPEKVEEEAELKDGKDQALDDVPALEVSDLCLGKRQVKEFRG